MKKKRICSLFLTLLTILTLLPGAALAAEEEQELWTRVEGDGSYVTIRLPYPEGADMIWSEYRNLSVRYADTGEPVALSSEYKNGYLFATVPAEHAGRPLEVFMGAPVEFQDCFVSWESDGKKDGFYDAPLGAEDLNIRGVFYGDDTGNLYAGQTITRAEAFAVICRLLGLKPAGDPGFADVSETDWYYDAASAARAAGITVEDTYFAPARTVSRGEFTVMLARAMQSVGWLAGGEGTAADLPFIDAADIPDWALESYLAFSSYDIGIFSYRDTQVVDEFGSYVQEVLTEPGKGATRGEVIEMIYDALRFLPVYPTQTAIEWGFDKEMPVIDGSTSTLPYTNTVYSAMFSNYYNHPDMPEKHSKSYYSYERLINGEADILFISTKPTEDTIAKAEAAGVELELIPIAYDAMVFFTNGENAIDDLTMEQIRRIYVDDAYDSWTQLGGPDAGLIPYCRNADSGSQAQMEEFFLKGDEIHPDIRRETTAVSMASVLTDVWEAKTDDPLAYALGYSIYYYYQQASFILLPDMDTLKLLKIEGVYPTDETIADGSYPLAGYNYAVVRADSPEGSLARRMVEFMLSPQGQQCVVNAGFGALSEKAIYDENRDGVLQTSEFPVPTGEAFGLTGADAKLYTAASADTMRKILPNVEAEDTMLLLTYLNVYGEYAGENGETHYVCGYGTQYYYDLGVGLADPENPVYSSMGGSGNPARITLAADGTLADIQETYDGADNTQRIRELCGPLTELAAAMLEGTAAPQRRLTPTGGELLRSYLDYYFPGN